MPPGYRLPRRGAPSVRGGGGSHRVVSRLTTRRPVSHDGRSFLSAPHRSNGSVRPMSIRPGTRGGSKEGSGGLRSRAGWDPPMTETPRKEVVQ